MGGREYGIQELDTILLYIPESDSWAEMPSKLEIPKYHPTVIPVKRSIFHLTNFGITMPSGLKINMFVVYIPIGLYCILLNHVLLYGK